MGQQEKETASEKALGSKPSVQKGKRVRTSSPTALQPMANFSSSHILISGTSEVYFEEGSST